MNLLVTGGAGFIGTNFVKMILRKRSGAKLVVIMDSLTYASDYENIREDVEDHPKLKFANVDIRDARYVDATFKKYGITHVMHFAAESHVDNAILDPARFAETNVIGTLNILEACRKYKVERLHHISTDEVFGHLEKGDKKFTEDTPYAPRNPYSASKASSDHLVRSYYHTYETPVTISNCSNNYGPYQHKEKFIPVVINSILKRKKIPVYGQGLNIRDWIHVDDHCDALLTILKKGKLGETYNIGANTEKRNLDVIHDICQILKVEPEDCTEFVCDRLGHDFRYAIDTTKIKKELRWKHKISFEKGIVKTVAHYKNVYDTEFSDRCDC
jgi:dTDP-glucose 4,6-dehydratase